MELRLLDFGRFRPRPTPAPAFAGPAQVRAYWEALRKDKALPDRAALDPRGMAGALDRVFLAEPIGRGLVQVRLAGSALSEAAGLNLRGLPLSCLFAPEARQALADVLEPVTRGRGLAELALGAAGQGPAEVARLLLLPLADGPERWMVLGCLGHAPGSLGPERRFTILRQSTEALETPPAPAREMPPSPAAPHLKLVHARD